MQIRDAVRLQQYVANRVAEGQDILAELDGYIAMRLREPNGCTAAWCRRTVWTGGGDGSGVADASICKIGYRSRIASERAACVGWRP